ncbi:hypothetical protein J1605_005634 [Eschrichtius robustus]|uniref:Uncharacterized protein n=1 Tax=Eschrichtius robustus TaxID=9764 RepID=A0AB34H5B0_ESCRO|nr:hypothetical protein J1605_005634 [Eschrichtius robustus]
MTGITKYWSRTLGPSELFRIKPTYSQKQKLSDMATQKEPSCLPFIFYRAKVGSWNTLESAAQPGWFVCTSCNPGEPVGMTNTCGRRKHTEFSFRQFCKAEMSPSEVRE